MGSPEDHVEIAFCLNSLIYSDSLVLTHKLFNSDLLKNPFVLKPFKGHKQEKRKNIRS